MGEPQQPRHRPAWCAATARAIATVIRLWRCHLRSRGANVFSIHADHFKTVVVVVCCDVCVCVVVWCLCGCGGCDSILDARVSLRTPVGAPNCGRHVLVDMNSTALTAPETASHNGSPARSLPNPTARTSWSTFAPHVTRQRQGGLICSVGHEHTPLTSSRHEGLHVVRGHTMKPTMGKTHSATRRRAVPPEELLPHQFDTFQWPRRLSVPTQRQSTCPTMLHLPEVRATLSVETIGNDVDKLRAERSCEHT